MQLLAWKPAWGSVWVKVRAQKCSPAGGVAGSVPLAVVSTPRPGDDPPLLGRRARDIGIVPGHPAPATPVH